MEPAKSAYVHIPFCDSICHYCDFVKLIKHPSWEASYIKLLIQDIQEKDPKDLSTIYVGGGTPSCLEEGLFSLLLEELSSRLGKGEEFTVECNPESLTRNKVALLKKAGVNRVSLGMQSSHDHFLSLMGRKHSFEDVASCVKALKEEGIQNINVDLIYGLPEETEKDLEEDLAALLSLEIPHISTYSLILEKGTRFYAQGIQEASQEDLADQYNLILSTLRKKGYERYEVSNFALPGYESSHNLTYWKNKPYIGFGLGASGYEEDIRYRITPSIQAYLKGVRKVEEEKVSLEEKKRYAFITNLRLKEGIDLEEYKNSFGSDLLIEKEEAIRKHQNYGNLCVESGRVFASDRGILLLDSILVDLI